MDEEEMPKIVFKERDGYRTVNVNGGPRGSRRFRPIPSKLREVKCGGGIALTGSL